MLQSSPLNQAEAGTSQEITLCSPLPTRTPSSFSHSLTGISREPFFNECLVPESLIPSPRPGKPDLREQASSR